MRTLTVKLDDDLADELERLAREGAYASKSDLVRAALRQWLIEQRKRQLRTNLARYLQDEEASQDAADAVESRMAATEEALQRADQSEET